MLGAICEAEPRLTPILDLLLVILESDKMVEKIPGIFLVKNIITTVNDFDYILQSSFKYPHFFTQL